MHRLLIILFGLSSITHAADFSADVLVYGATGEFEGAIRVSTESKRAAVRAECIRADHVFD